jgi:hypothetical protein
MKMIELIADVQKDGTVFLNLSAPTIVAGKHKFLVVIEENLLEDEFEESDETEIEDWIKEELDKREVRMNNAPHPGYTMEEVIQRLEAKIGRKLQV